MAQNPHEYLIEQLQFTGDESVGSSSNKIKLNFNHPCKELIWVVQPDENVDYCSSFECGTHLYKVFGAQPFNYTDAIDALPNGVQAFGGPQATPRAHMKSLHLVAFSRILVPVMLLRPHLQATWPGYYSLIFHVDEDSGVSDAGTFVLTETSLELHCWGENPVVTGKLQLNGQDRFSEREGTYFDLVQPWQHHTRNPDSLVLMFTLLPSAQKSISHLAHAISPVLIMLPSSSFFPMRLLRAQRLLRFAYTLLTTTSFAS